MSHRYTLETYTDTHSRTMCPKCRHRRDTFKRYIDTQTGSYLADHVGRCERIESCGYHYPPREYFNDNPDARPQQQQPPMNDTKHYTLLAWPLLERTMKAYKRNNFVLFLVKLFGREKTQELVLQYLIGTAAHWPGATVFWQLDYNEKVRAGKVMLYNPGTGKRVKQPFNHITWVHSLLVRGAGGVVPGTRPPEPGLHIKQCLFGEHLLAQYPAKVVAIAESEKTAIIASAYLPQYVWLAAGSLEGLTAERCKVLQHRNVLLFPDVNGYPKWREKMRELRERLPNTKFLIDDTLDRHATPADRAKGIDIADKWIEQTLK